MYKICCYIPIVDILRVFVILIRRFLRAARGFGALGPKRPRAALRFHDVQCYFGPCLVLVHK